MMKKTSASISAQERQISSELRVVLQSVIERTSFYKSNNTLTAKYISTLNNHIIFNSVAGMISKSLKAFTFKQG